MKTGVQPARLARGAVYILGLLLALAGQPALAADGSRYQRTVAALPEATSEIRGDFAAIALAQLAEAYLAEARQARTEAVGVPGSTRLLSWSRGVERYVRELWAAHAEVAQGHPVELQVLPMSDAAVTVAGRTVILSHPRRDQQAVFEQAALAEFCTAHDCLQLLAVAPAGNREPIPVSALPRSADWVFTARGNVCVQQGLSLHFSPGGSLPRQRKVCAQLFAELQTLLVELRWQQRQGVMIDWSVFTLAAAPDREQHLVTLNGAGDALLLNLPLLYRSDGLTERLQGWLQASLAGSVFPELILPATDYNWGQ
ncbi:hypothetical protein CWI75_14070 [Kineobactrum sediminis]|uniref:Uncharacterized protein n=1 Tax=Kineobactrum sediminis TaxID=1905677 RepID=A0A2N5Y0E8_9GAMM|nr:hypothetical protein [Kineobactrum sediminis]PLW81865.1 hypothetical protein CWI75_14070 [Kineobactrum sediminis]